MIVRVPCHGIGSHHDRQCHRRNRGAADFAERCPHLARIPPWIEHLAAQYSIPENTQFAMIFASRKSSRTSSVTAIRASRTGPSSSSSRTRATTIFVFVIEDEAPPFNPLEAPELPVLRSLDELRVGGNGIRLLREFAQALEYQATPTGNRLVIGFSAAD